MKVFVTSKFVLLCFIVYYVDCSDVSHRCSSRTEQLDPNFQLQWTFNDTCITFKVVVNTSGWVGIGFSPSGGMAGADIVIGWVANSKVYLKDRYAEKQGKPHADVKQDYELIEGSESGNQTRLVFRRKLQTCDRAKDYAIKYGQTTRVIYAYSNTDPKDEENIPYHGSTKGVKSTNLLDCSTNEHYGNYESEDVKALDILNRNTTLTRQQTLYWCELYALPEMEEKHHIIRLEPVIQENMLGIVHHMLLYACQPNFNASAVATWSSACYGLRDMPRDLIACDIVVHGWAVGGKGYSYPEHVGYPIHPGYGYPKYFFLETHYDNPGRLNGIQDSSGFRLFYTRQLRKHDAGTLLIGQPIDYPPMIIPPNVTEFTIRSTCSSSCTSKYTRKEGVKLTAVLLHAHLSAVKLGIRHYRKDIELPPLAMDEHYDFNYQQQMALNKEVTFLPGDTLILECTFNTSGRQSPLYSGITTADEMCLSYVSHYPALNLTKCFSSIYYTDILRTVAARKMKHYEDWNTDAINEYKSMVEEAHTYYEYCMESGSGIFTENMVPHIRRNFEPSKMYVEPNACKKSSS